MVSGEMGRSIFAHPESYQKLVTKYRGTLAAGKWRSRIKVGLALHWNKVCGNCFYVSNGSDKKYNQTYAQVRGAVVVWGVCVWVGMWVCGWTSRVVQVCGRVG